MATGSSRNDLPLSNSENENEYVFGRREGFSKKRRAHLN